MKVRTVIYSVVACGALAISTGVMGQTAPSYPTPMEQGAASRLVLGDRDFLDNAAHAGHTEIEGSKLAQIHSKNPDVKAFADRMMKDHIKMSEELTALAKSKGHELSTGSTLMQMATLKTLDMRDESFDEKYASQMGVSAHENALKAFQAAATEAQDPDIKEFVVRNLPVLQQHLEIATALKQKVTPEK